jgi:hypothetical protein
LGEELSMAFSGVLWGTIICIPFWLLIILLIKLKMIGIVLIIFAGLALPWLSLILTRNSDQNIPVRFPAYELRHFGDRRWYKISEKTVMERLAESFNPVSPILSRLIQGEEIIISEEIYRKFQMGNMKTHLISLKTL